MSANFATLIVVFFLTSVVSVVTGSTSLITVPVMIALGIEAHVAVATNMLALTFMSVGGSLPFMGKGVLSRSRLLPSIFLTIAGSGLGALLLLKVPLKALQITIAVAMISVAVFSLLNKNLGQTSHDAPASHVGVVAGYATTFLLAIYGGFFSGGYVTMLTAAFVVLSAGRGYHEGGQRVFFRGGDAGVCLARRCGFEARPHPWCLYVSGCAAGRTHRSPLEHSLATADIHCGSPGPSCQAALASALTIDRFTHAFSTRANIGRVPSVVVRDLKTKKVA
jgi:hypothetical protein